jgi:hypothetical protein
MLPREAALAAQEAGISVLPPKQDGTKAPDSPSWLRHQTSRATTEQVEHWYSNGRTGVGWVTGAVSGNLEVIDFDDRSTLAEYERLARDSGLAPLLERVKLGYFERTPNGAHLVYRCTKIDGNKKLAKGAVMENAKGRAITNHPICAGEKPRPISSNCGTTINPPI